MGGVRNADKAIAIPFSGGTRDVGYNRGEAQIMMKTPTGGIRHDFRCVKFACAFVLTLASIANGQSTPKQDASRERSIAEIVKASSPAVVLVVTFDASGN